MIRLLGFALCLCSVAFAQTTSNPTNASGAAQAPVQSQAAQENVAPSIALGTVRATHPIANGLEIESENGRLQVTALQDDVIRVRATRANQFAARYSYAVLPTPAGAQPSFAAKTQESADAVELDTAALRIRVDRRSSKVSFLGADGALIAGDSASITWRGDEFTVHRSMPEDEHYFGLGDKAGPLDHRNQAFTMWNTDAYGWQESTDPLYKTLGFLLTLRKGMSYGIFLDSTFRQHWDLGKESP
ncbi:MAG TPA: hypothetical protein VJR04_13210, partial [Terriglobales bacterium]|nr:hypothetical protein [Terriglobales bacterium]